ncbi:MAG: MBL fold metallo-hydrolase [Syntrophaceae bacterium]|nr:MBL fold metallo-hydrolase [Syntrophaceae bacterium]
MRYDLKQVDKIEIITLQDNYIDLVAQDNNEIIKRALPLEGSQIKNSILAEHGFSAFIAVNDMGTNRNLLFDFGFSIYGAAVNADILGLDLTKVETLALSHGHPDHTGGLEKLAQRIGKKGIELVVHPAAFRNPRYNKTVDARRVFFPPFTRERVDAADISLYETTKPHFLLDDSILFMGEIPRVTDFEKGIPTFCYEEEGQEKADYTEDDTAIVANLKGKGLLVLSGCAHSGIINTIRYAQELTGVSKIFAVIGGFHLSGAYFEPLIKPTIEALKSMDPEYILPTHCTGRTAIMAIEKEMPDKFLLNMSGTTLTFKA